MNLDARCGQRIGVFGPNGAGKSTLLKALAGLVRPAQGEMLWDGAPLSRARHEVAYLPQREEADFEFPITVRAVVEMGRFPALGWFRRFGPADREAVERAVEAMGLDDLQDRQVGALSGGQQQRVFLARALAQQAHVLLLDEPFAGLDAPARAVLGSQLRQLADEGRLVMVTHHNLGDAERLFDEVLLLRRMQVAVGAPSEVLGDPALRAKAGLPT